MYSNFHKNLIFWQTTREQGVLMLVEGYKKIMHDLHQNFFQNTFYNKLLKYERFESLNIPRDWVVGMEEHASLMHTKENIKPGLRKPSSLSHTHTDTSTKSEKK